MTDFHSRRSLFAVSLTWGTVWLFIWGSLTPISALGSLVVGFVAAQLSRQMIRGTRPLAPRVAAGARLGFLFLGELILSTLAQVRTILSPRLKVEPGWLEIPTTVQTETGRALLATLVSMTPGTVTSAIDDDVLLVHALQAGAPDETIRRIREKIEAPILRLEGSSSRIEEEEGA